MLYLFIIQFMIKKNCNPNQKESMSRSNKKVMKNQEKISTCFSKKSECTIEQSGTKILQNQDNQDKKKQKNIRKKTQKVAKETVNNINDDLSKQTSISKQTPTQPSSKDFSEQVQYIMVDDQNLGDDCANQFCNIILTNIQKQSKNKPQDSEPQNNFNNRNQQLISSCSVQTLKKISINKVDDSDFFLKSENTKHSKRLLILEYQNEEVYIHENQEEKIIRTHKKLELIPDDIKTLFLQKKNLLKIPVANKKYITEQTYETSNPSSNQYTPCLTPRSNESNQPIMRQRTSSFTNQIPLNGNYISQIYQPMQNNYGYQQYYKEYLDYYEQKLYQCNRKRRAISYQQSKDYIIQLSKIQSDGRTTVMIRNIPNKYTQEMLIQLILRNNKKKYDFFYLPLDYTNSCNMGYAFINFLHTKFIADFYKEFNSKKWEKFNSEKICSLSYARIQGTMSLITHIENSGTMNQKNRKPRPLIGVDGELMNNLETIIEKQKQYQ